MLAVARGGVAGGTKGHGASAAALAPCARPRRGGHGGAGARGPVPGGPTAPLSVFWVGTSGLVGCGGAGAWLATEPGALRCDTHQAVPRYRQPEAPGHPAVCGLGGGAEPGSWGTDAGPAAPHDLLHPLPTGSWSSPHQPQPRTRSRPGGEPPLGPPRSPCCLWPRSGLCGWGGKQRPHRRTPHPPTPPQVRAFLQPPLKGVVLETFGSGNGPTKPDLLQELRAAAERGVLILNCTHCLRGSVTSRYAAGMVGRGTRPGEAGAGPGAQGRLAWEPAPHLPPAAPPSRPRPEPASSPAST